MNKTTPSLSDLSPVQRRLIAWRVGRGMPLAQAAAMEGIGAAEAQPLLQDQAFLDLLDGVRQMAEGSRQDRRNWLVEIARQTVEQAAAGGDLEAAQVLRQFDCSRQGKAAHRTPASPTGRPAVSAKSPAKAASANSGPSAQSCNTRNVRAEPMVSPAAGTVCVSTARQQQPATRPVVSLPNVFPIVRPKGRAPFSFSPRPGAVPHNHPFQPHGPPAMSIL